MESVGLKQMNDNVRSRDSGAGDFWLDRPTLVTGATGLVGGWLVRRLVDARADVVCLVRDWVPQSELVRSRAIENVKVARGDVRDQAALERVLGAGSVAVASTQGLLSSCSARRLS